VSWHTAWDAEARRRIADTGRLKGVNAIGVDEHVWSHTGPPGTGMVTGIVDHTRDAKGIVQCPPAGPCSGAIREGLRRLAPGARTGFHRRDQDGRAGSVPGLRERDPS
jgi:hypothetical protein